jgi:hypothetical protein
MYSSTAERGSQHPTPRRGWEPNSNNALTLQQMFEYH